MSRLYPTGQAKVAGVVGQPIRQSLSPFLHSHWLENLGIDGVYAPFSPPDAHGFERLILSCRSNGIVGLNITAPFKEQALKLCDEVSDRAREAGSVNLMRFDPEGYIMGDSTDGLGLIKAFEHQAPHCDLSKVSVALLGAGGAARSVVSALLHKGCKDIRIVNRTKARAEDLVFQFQSGVTAYDLTQIETAFAGVGAVINAASGGPLPDIKTLGPDCVLMDMTYRPLMTAWLQLGRAQGLAVVDGLEMLIEQARPSFESFYGQAPDLDYPIRQKALAYLGEA